MKKRIQMDLFLEEENYDNAIKDFLNAIKAKAVNISIEEKSHIKVHDCGHDEHGACTNVEVLL